MCLLAHELHACAWWNLSLAKNAEKLHAFLKMACPWALMQDSIITPVAIFVRRKDTKVSLDLDTCPKKTEVSTLLAATGWIFAQRYNVQRFGHRSPDTGRPLVGIETTNVQTNLSWPAHYYNLRKAKNVRAPAERIPPKILTILAKINLLCLDKPIQIYPFFYYLGCQC